MKELEGVMYGSDPELLVQDLRTGQNVVASTTDGKKGAPEKLGYIAENMTRTFRTIHADLPDYGVLRDGVCIEFNLEPATTPYMAWVRAHLAYKDYDRRINASHNHGLLARPSRIFTKETLDAAPPDAAEIGCAADYDAYADNPEEPRNLDIIQKFYNEGVRMAGGHVHLSYPETGVPKYVVARLCDMFTSPYRLYMEQDHRHNTYGAPGMYRPTSYGIEYRTPNNQWVEHAAAGRPLFAGLKAVAYVLQNMDLVKTLWEDMDWSALREGHLTHMGYKGVRFDTWLHAKCDTIDELKPVLDILDEPFTHRIAGEQGAILRHAAGGVNIAPPPMNFARWIHNGDDDVDMEYDEDEEEDFE